MLKYLCGHWYEPFFCGLLKITILSKGEVGRQPKRFWSFIRRREECVIPVPAEKSRVDDLMMES